MDEKTKRIISLALNFLAANYDQLEDWYNEGDNNTPLDKDPLPKYQEIVKVAEDLFLTPE